ncbi:MAG: hypothetical protein KDI36_06420 [Pseudomonadales bacterium]|nr:hypothetical protein [Pseudomonadales bacterium]
MASVASNILLSGAVASGAVASGAAASGARRLGAFVLCAAILTFSDPLLAARNQCGKIYEPALPGYEFTGGVDRWGERALVLPDGEGRKVSKIYINSLPVFDTTDPKESNALYRWINRIHIGTRTHVISDLLLFHEGERVDNQLIQETERLLRDQKFLADAEIRVVNECGDDVELEVVTREVWTLTPEVSFKTSGGDNASSIALGDSNFLGTGKNLKFSFKKDSERDIFFVHYKDTNVFGEHYLLRTHYEDNSDGYHYLAQFGKPFYAMDVRQSWLVSAEKNARSISFYDYGDTVSSIKEDSQNYSVYYGVSDGLVDGHAERWLFGVAYNDRQFRPDPGEPLPPVVTSDITLFYPFIEYQNIEDQYKVGFNINQIQRLEDIYTGESLRSRFGISTEDATRLVFEGEWRDTFLSRRKQLLQANVTWSGNWNFDANELEETFVVGRLDYHRGQTDNRSLVLSMSGQLLEKPFPHQQLLLGGSNGLRGYDSRYLSGDAALLLSAEERLFTDWEPFGLFNVGFAAFADVGRTWNRQNLPVAEEDWKFDVGFGLRLIPSKADKGQVIHIDVAFPVGDSAVGSSPQFIAELKQSL